MKSVLNDFTEDVGDGLVDLLVDAILHVLLGVNHIILDKVLLVALIIKNHAISLLTSHVQHVLRADSSAVASADWVEALVSCVVSVAGTVI